MQTIGATLPNARARIAAVIAASTFLLPGCRDETAPAPADPSTASARTVKPAASTEASSTTASNAIAATVDASGRRWLTPKVPYDVFPDLPPEGEIVATAGEIPPKAAAATAEAAAMIASTGRATTVPEGTAATTVPMPMPPGGEPSPVPSAGDRETVLPLETLRNEIAAVNNDLGKKLLTVGSYNDSFEQVSVDGWVMSALATIAAEHPASISWKGNALLARDAAVAVAMSATARGRESFNEAQLASEQLSAVLNNNTPSGLPAPDPAASREETADRAALMTRMQSAFDTLKEIGADESAFHGGRETAGHEAGILAALARFTSHSDYGSAEESEYQAAARELIASGAVMTEAAAAEDHAAFKAALDGVGTTCNTCHQKYRFEN
ncbi:MAG: cytochrome c [Planctomycetaceae bacterium]